MTKYKYLSCFVALLVAFTPSGLAGEAPESSSPAAKAPETTNPETPAPAEPVSEKSEKAESSIPPAREPDFVGPEKPEAASPPGEKTEPAELAAKEPETAGPTTPDSGGDGPEPAGPPAKAPDSTAPPAKEPDGSDVKESDKAEPEKAEPADKLEAEKPDPTKPPPWKANDGDGIWFNFRDAEVSTILTHISEVTGLVVIRADGEIEGKITVESRQRLNVDEAISVLNSVLKEKGYAGVRVGRMLKIIKITEAVKSNIPVHVGADPEQIKETDEIITQIIPLKRVEARQLMQDLNDLFSQEASVAANQNANALILTDASANIRRIAKVIMALDQSDPAVAKVEVYPLKYADATEAARLVEEIFQTDTRSSRSRSRDPRQRFFEFMRGRGGRGGPPGGDERRSGPSGTPGGSGVEPIPITASADQRTNTVVVSGPEETLVVVREVLEKLDSNPASQQDVFVYRVKYGQALQIESVVNMLFGATGMSSSRMGTRGTTRGTSMFGSSARTGSRGGSSSALRSSGLGDSSSSPFGGGGMGGRGGSSSSRGSGFSGRGGSTSSRFGGMASVFRGGGGRLSSQSLQSAADLYGQVYAVADEDTNSVLVMTASSAIDIVRHIIQELDTPVPQVLIKVLIAEVTHTKGIDLGVEGTILDIPQNSVLFSDFAVAAQSGGLIYRLLERDIQATIRLLAEHSKLEVLSRPYILASDNQEATITVGQEVPFIRNTRITQNDSTVNTIEYEDVGIILIVVPHTNREGIVTLDVAPEISAISGETVPISETVDAPVIVKRSATTRAAIADGQTIVIGGLVEDQVTETVQKIPLLGDIPILGNLFRRKQREKSKTELLIFLTPHVAQNPYALKRMAEEEKKGIEIIPKAVEEGAFENQLKGMERGKSPESEVRNERYQKELEELQKQLEAERLKSMKEREPDEKPQDNRGEENSNPPAPDDREQLR